MSLVALFLLLAAAAIHAGWNALVKSEADRLRSIAILAVFGTLAALPLTLFVTPPAIASWPFMLASGMLQVGYCFFLVRAYDHGDLVSVYPIARGSAPVFVTLGAAFFVREWPDDLGLAGIALVASGVFALALGANRPEPKAIQAALVTGLFVASYTIVDGLGVRASGSALGYVVWQASLAGALIVIAFVVARRTVPKLPPGKAGISLAIAGILSALAYGISVWAMSIAAMGEVSAVRETSILFAALFGAVFLKERFTWQMTIGVFAVAAGVACLSAT